MELWEELRWRPHGSIVYKEVCCGSSGGVAAISSGCCGPCIYQMLHPIITPDNSRHKYQEFYIVHDFDDAFPMMERLIDECAKAQEQGRNTALTILCRYAQHVRSRFSTFLEEDSVGDQI